jgi:hypothetical protein
MKTSLRALITVVFVSEFGMNSIHATTSKRGRKAIVVYTVEAEAKAVQAA